MEIAKKEKRPLGIYLIVLIKISLGLFILFSISIALSVWVKIELLKFVQNNHILILENLINFISNKKIIFAGNYREYILLSFAVIMFLTAWGLIARSRIVLYFEVLVSSVLIVLSIGYQIIMFTQLTNIEIREMSIINFFIAVITIVMLIYFMYIIIEKNRNYFGIFRRRLR